MRSLKPWAKATVKNIFRSREPDEVLDIYLHVGLLFLFIGCWLSVHLGLSFVVCGSVLVFIVQCALKKG